jgi:hypothetical protein
MKRHAYLLILLLLWSQADDVLAFASVLPSAPLADDDDNEYVPSQRREQEEESRPDNTPAFAGHKPQTADFPLVRRGVRLEWNLITPFTPAPLYVFLSLQI